MHAKAAGSLLAVALLAPTSIKAQVQTILIPGFGQGEASVSQAGVGADGSTTFIATPTNTAGGDFASITGAVTIIASGSNSESKFQLVDGSSVDDKCSFNGTQAFCSEVVVNGGATANTAFATQLPPGFVAFGQAQPSVTAAAGGPIETIVIPGFGTGGASVSQGGVGPDGSTTFIVSPTPTAGGDFASISGAVTVLSGGSGSEAKFQLVDGSNVDSKCSVNGNQASCSAVIVNGGNTQVSAFQTQLPAGFAALQSVQASGSSAQPTQTAQSAQATSQSGQSASQAGQTSSGFSTVVTTASQSSSSESAQPSQTDAAAKKNGALRIGAKAAGALLSVGVAAGLLL
ncbi:hypothetical protein BC629DRAFT_1730886 [Irpex lacteus]|nr:hypothetical protein BC629DRAFT_1730886 [Irpex lacteus]